ncbi:Spy/CpxP family protein refolding chaperone [Psychroserpens sp. NJDZ02]|uniref:Spy/CpxP family protein refolding chaperone n=1 Tax=Psychroserpens sp. NJDZ02 TaxID=2570561 RepID=UPI0010A8C685|nr:Spy/CpxP family protein refolding chaperone [Psychroserpens sp. NJDZ02]QCE42196.1 hypothetical protein E9099_12545 [Psychroserpens sp. NJDZ02]
MKKNTVLYLLLIVLIIMNVFFLFNYIGRPGLNGRKESGNFIATELKFNDKQLEQFKSLETKHYAVMRAVGDEIRSLKDQLFNNISAASVNQQDINNLTTAIAGKVILRENELFKRLRDIYQLCDDNQKEQFKSIIKKSRRFDMRGPEHPGRPE